MQPTLEQWLARKPKGKAPRKRIRKMSKRREGANREYAIRRKRYLAEHPTCDAFHTIIGWAARNWKYDELAMNTWYFCVDPTTPPPSVEIHHMKKPKCKYLNDESTWLAVARWSHNFIEQNKSVARDLGLLS